MVTQITTLYNSGKLNNFSGRATGQQELRSEKIRSDGCGVYETSLDHQWFGIFELIQGASCLGPPDCLGTPLLLWRMVSGLDTNQ